MKKLVSLVLALALCLGLAAPALAVEYTPQTHKCYWCEDNTVLTIDKVAFIDYKYYIPVGATVTYTVSETGHYEGAVGHLCISSAYYFTNDAPTIVHWSYDPAVGAMVRTDSAEYVNHSNCPDLPAGASYTFTITEEMAESTAIFNSLDYYGVEITAGCFTDVGSEICTRTILGIPDSTTPVEPETPDETVDDTPAGETGDDAPTGEVGDDTPAGETGDDTPAAEPTTTPVEGGVTYTVKQYDTMGKIALNYYGSYGYHLALYKANADAFAKTGGNFNTGMTLTLPDTLAGKTRLAEPTLAEGESFYTVKAGDTLGAIAAATYGNVMEYVAIYERNADRLKNANTIFEGQVIVLPAK